ncbi:MAG: DUF2244 domain-containing protein [Hyphomicrobiaceae bacterium]|nr:DUF2244 domain-containing protein [Hyphomicrobiaceae bacterium]MCC0009543.1 DUF2244 domain-containing protein [Hyphomicrobiaceae bacterium]
MTNDDNSAPGPATPPHTRWVLTSYRSLSPRGFLILMSLLGLVSFTAGITFLLMGAWPVFGFFGLDVLLIYIAFKLNYRDGRLHETVDLDSHQLTVTRYHPSGRTETFGFNPYWVRVSVSEAVDGRTSLSLTSHGKLFQFGSFLTDDERKEFGGVLGRALQKARMSAHA